MQKSCPVNKPVSESDLMDSPDEKINSRFLKVCTTFAEYLPTTWFADKKQQTASIKWSTYTLDHVQRKNHDTSRDRLITSDNNGINNEFWQQS